MNKISCDICMDLIPLVKDGIASPDSELAVKNHVQKCTVCKAFFAAERNELMDCKLNDEKIWKKIKSQINKIILGIIGLSILFGAGLSMSQNMFYNILIMPMIGAIGYLILKKKVYWVVIAVFAITFSWNVIMSLLDHQDINFIGDLIGFVWFSIIYALLCMIGVVIAGLLRFATKKERK